MREELRRLFPMCWQDGVTLVVTMAAALDLGLILQPLGADDSHAALIFVLGVLVVSRFTSGYFFGMIASFVAVVVVNYAFVPPHYRFDVHAAGYAMTVVTMFSVSLVTGILTSQIKEQEQIRVEAERERLRANLLRAVGHDLRTPLTSIVGSAEAILENANQLTRSEKLTLLKNVRNEADWMIRMVENLLSITRVGGNSEQILKRPEVPEEVVGEVVEKFQKHFPDVSVEVEVPDAWEEVPMDAMLIEQVLYNLMENAVVHGQAGEIKIQVERTAQWAQFSVSDDGSGLPDEKQGNLRSDYMELAETSAGDKKHNMGIGLLVCRDIIQVHGGKFLSHNRPEGGAVFCFLLPMEEERHGHQRQDSGHRR